MTVPHAGVRETSRRLLLALLGVGVCVASGEAAVRHRSVIAAFITAHGYPVGYTKGSHVVDHKWPLCNGGKDGEPNLQWQEVGESYRKDVDERALCAHVQAFSKKWGVSR